MRAPVVAQPLLRRLATQGGEMNLTAASVTFPDGPEHEVVLIVEPDAFYRTLLTRALLDEGFEVRSPETLECDTERPQLAIVNLEDLEEEDVDVLLADMLGPHSGVPHRRVPCPRVV